jgi:hypothetical protein
VVLDKNEERRDRERPSPPWTGRFEPVPHVWRVSPRPFEADVTDATTLKQRSLRLHLPSLLCACRCQQFCRNNRRRQASRTHHGRFFHLYTLSACERPSSYSLPFLYISNAADEATSRQHHDVSSILTVATFARAPSGRYQYLALRRRIHHFSLSQERCQDTSVSSIAGDQTGRKGNHGHPGRGDYKAAPARSSCCTFGHDNDRSR